jgi:2-oxoglutarate dehydrogenase E2 component (dihydrolipoamide succinyltransferase)
MVNVILPPLGENIVKATISFWFFKVGDTVQEKDDLVELTTDKAAFNLPSPATGKLIEILYQEGDSVKPGDILAHLQE